MDIELFHESMNAVPAVMRVVQAIDPISHAPIAQDEVESFIILLDQLGDDLVFFFRFWAIGRKFEFCAVMPIHYNNTRI